MVFSYWSNLNISNLYFQPITLLNCSYGLILLVQSTQQISIFLANHIIKLFLWSSLIGPIYTLVIYIFPMSITEMLNLGICIHLIILYKYLVVGSLLSRESLLLILKENFWTWSVWWRDGFFVFSLQLFSISSSCRVL